MTLLHEKASARVWGFLRIWVFGLWFADVLKDPLSRLAEIPVSELRAVGILRWLPDRFWPVIVVLLVDLEKLEGRFANRAPTIEHRVPAESPS